MRKNLLLYIIPFLLYNTVMTEGSAELKAKGKELLKQQQYRAAIPVFEKLHALLPDDVYPLDVLGFLYYMVNRFPEARACCESSIKLKPDNFYAYKGLGLCLVRLGDNTAGIEMLKKSISLNPGYFDSYYDLGVTYLELRDYKQARHYFTEAGKVSQSENAAVKKALAYLDSLEDA